MPRTASGRPAGRQGGLGGCGRQRGARVTLTEGGAEIDLYDLKIAALPIYDGDIEDSGFPDEVVRFNRMQVDILREITIQVRPGIPVNRSTLNTEL